MARGRPAWTGPSGAPEHDSRGPGSGRRNPGPPAATPGPWRGRSGPGIPGASGGVLVGLLQTLADLPAHRLGFGAPRRARRTRVAADLLGQQQRQERLHDVARDDAAVAVPVVAAADDDARHHVDARDLDRFREPVHHLLGELEARPPVGAHLLLDGHGLRHAHARSALRLGARERQHLARLALAEDADARGLGAGDSLDLRRLLLRACQVGLAGVRLDLNRQLGLRDVRLLFGAGLGLTQLALLHR